MSLAHANLKGQTVYVVDDDAAVRNSLKFALGVDGYDVATYETADAFLQSAGDVHDGCLILDYHLPDMTGLELAQRLHELGIEVPVILITTNPGRDLQQLASAKGIRIIEKPLITGFLNAAIRTAMLSRREAAHRKQM